MNRQQKANQSEIRRIMNHLDVKKNKTDPSEYKKVHRSIEKMIKAMRRTEDWMKRSKKQGVYFGLMKLDMEEEKTVKVLLIQDGREEPVTAVLCEIKGA